MEGLNISSLAFIVISLSLFRVSILEQSFGYLGCFKDDSEQSLVDENGRRVIEQIKYNNGSICKRVCKNIHMRYAGTKRDFCICINTITNFQTSTSCTDRCPGNSHEICGSMTGTSLYDTRLKPTQRTRRMTKISTTKNRLTTRHIRSNPIDGSTIKMSTNALVTRKADVTKRTRPSKKTSRTVESPRINTTDSIYSADSNSEKPLIAVYITIPVVVLVAGATTLSIFVILRRRRLKGYANDVMHKTLQCPAIVNAEFTTTGTGRRNISTSIGCTKSSDRNQDCELTYDDINVADIEYTTINPSSTDLPERYHQYGHLKIQPGLFVGENKNYSHLVLNETVQNSNVTDTLYSHTGIGKSQDDRTATGYDVDVTYNRLNATPLLNIDKTTNIVVGQGSVYDHAVAGGNDPTVNDTEYSHLDAMKVKDQNTYSRCFTANNAFSSDNKAADRGYEQRDDHINTYFILEPENNTNADTGM